MAFRDATDSPASGALGVPLLLLLAGAIGSIVTALGFEHIGGYEPCPLCLQQRYAYYAGIPATIAAIVALKIGVRTLAMVLFAAVAVAFALNAGLGVYHSGVEWGFWQGPTTCAGGAGGVADSVDNLLGGGISQATVVRCDEAPWRMLGLSFAGWNAVISTGLAVLAYLCLVRSKAAAGA